MTWLKLLQAQLGQQSIQRIVVGVELAGDLFDGLQELRVVQNSLNGLGHWRAAEHGLQGVGDRGVVERAAIEEAQSTHDHAGGDR